MTQTAIPRRREGVNCIYCRALTDGSEGVAHVFPEGLVSNDVTLEPGAVCDACNNHLGTNLDAALVDHPLISFAIQWLGLRGGKEGKVRLSIGDIERDPRGQSITIPVEIDEDSVMWDQEGRIASRDVEVAQLAKFGADEWRFSRALYHVGLNVIAHAEGPEFALHADFDPVRRYVRTPDRKDRWPYAIRSGELRRIPELIRADTVPGAPDGVLRLVLFQTEVWVDLRNRPTFRDWVDEALPDDVTFRVPRRPSGQRRKKRYEMTIYL
jgi:hypothetical protein